MCCNFFGTHDSWYPNARMSFVDRSDMTSMLADMDTLVLDEKQFDGFDSHDNPKHWHIFDVIARKNS